MNLSTKSYKELQCLAKQYGIKANQSSAVLVSLLLPFVASVTDQPTAEQMTAETIPEVTEARTEQPITIEYKVASKVQVLHSNEWTSAAILRINKKSIRVILSNDDEITVKMDEIRPCNENHNVKEQEVIVSTEDNFIQSNVVSSLADIDESCPLSHESLVEALMSEVKYSDIVDELAIDELQVLSEDEEMIKEDLEKNIIEEDVEGNGVNENELDLAPNMNLSFVSKQPKCVEWNSSAKVSSTFDKTVHESNFNSKKRKSFSNTPVSKVSKPAYEVKLTKAQQLRAHSNKMKLQAIENKRLEDNIAKNPFEYVNRPKFDHAPSAPPAAKKQVIHEEKIAPTNPIVNRNPLAIVRSVSAPSNFKKDHEKIFKNQKSITDICKRDDNISINMSRAFEAAKHGFKTKPTSSTIVKDSISKRVSTSNIYDKENLSNVNVTQRGQRAESMLEVNRKLDMIQYR